MEQTTKITQIVTTSWTGNDGKARNDIVGLGDDGQLYQWSKFKGTWVQYIVVSG